MIKLINDNCLKAFKNIEGGSIDCIIADPPYLMNYKTNYRKNKNHDFCKPIYGDDDSELIHRFIVESYRVLKNNKAMYMFCNSNKIDFFKKEIEDAGFKIKNIIVWVKNNWTAGDLQASFGKQYEFIILANKGRCKFNGKRLSDVWEFPRVVGSKQLHQNQKPLDLIKLCIKKHTNEGDLILDPFMGVGTVGLACKELERSYIGIEINKNYYEISNDLINN